MEPLAPGLGDLAAAYCAGRLDPVAVAEAYLARIAVEDGALRSYITVDREGARAAAAASARRWAAGRALGPLDGAPLAVKDNIDVAGLPCTAGTAAFRDRVPRHDAPVIARLRAAGAVLLGKLNMHEAAFGATTDNPVYGRCMNPLRPGWTPGGSSGGSGAAVAARLCVAALGSDTMGSVRLPAAYCGVYGVKPSNGAVSTDGVVPLSVTLDAVGPLARSLDDAAMLLRAIAEPWPRGPRTGPDREAALAGLRLGVPRQLADIALTPAVAAAFAAAVERLRMAGAAVVDIDIAGWRPGEARRAGLLVSEAEGHLYYAGMLGSDLPGLSPGLAAMLRYPERAGAGRLAAAYAQIEAVRLACLDALTRCNALLLSTAPHTSFPHDGDTPASQADCTALANFARAPSVSLPMATDDLPAGLQLLAAPGEDWHLLGVAAAVDRALIAGGLAPQRSG